MRRLMKSVFAVAGCLVGLTLTAPAQAGVLVGQCVEFGPCYNGGPTPWSATLSFADLTSLGLGTSTPFITAQTSQFVIRLGVTTINFVTGSGPVTASLGEFSGSLHNDPCNLCEVDTVGLFFIPTDALSATISGTFGNSVVSSSGGNDLFLGDINTGTVPEPASWLLMIGGFGLTGSALRRRARTAVTA